MDETVYATDDPLSKLTANGLQFLWYLVVSGKREVDDEGYNGGRPTQEDQDIIAAELAKFQGVRDYRLIKIPLTLRLQSVEGRKQSKQIVLILKQNLILKSTNECTNELAILACVKEIKEGIMEMSDYFRGDNEHFWLEGALSGNMETDNKFVTGFIKLVKTLLPPQLKVEK